MIPRLTLVTDAREKPGICRHLRIVSLPAAGYVIETTATLEIGKTREYPEDENRKGELL